MTWLSRLLKEPLLHFLFLGAAIFAVFTLIRQHEVPEPGSIVVSRGKIENLAALFARTWQRPPARMELEGLIDDHVREEVLYREGIALGLDRDDIIVRRRLRQKMEFIAEDVAARTEPTDDDLRRYLEAHPEAFRIEPRLTFLQIYLNPERRGDSIDDDAQRLLDELRTGTNAADSAELGDGILLQHRYDALWSSDVARLLGERFAAEVAQLPTGEWHGPITSGYGLHLVKVEDRAEGRLPALDEVREVVEREWANERRKEAAEQFYRDLLKRYTVRIDGSWLDDESSGVREDDG